MQEPVYVCKVYKKQDRDNLFCQVYYRRIENFPSEYHMIAPEGGFDSIGNVFNYTLHRILDYGGSESDVKSILGAVKLSKKELKEKSFFFELDDGYVMPGLVKLLK